MDETVILRRDLAHPGVMSIRLDLYNHVEVDPECPCTAVLRMRKRKTTNTTTLTKRVHLHICKNLIIHMQTTYSLYHGRYCTPSCQPHADIWSSIPGHISGLSCRGLAITRWRLLALLCMIAMRASWGDDLL